MSVNSLPDTPTFTLHFDGSCSPNPGPMGAGFTLSKEGQPIVTAGVPLGHGTNNKAEYLALILGLRHALRLGMWRLEVRSDSALVVNQVKGQWKVSRGLQALHLEAVGLSKLFTSFSIRYVPREENREADALSREDRVISPPLPPPSQYGRPHRVLLPWQAAAIKVWYKQDRNMYRLARIFDISDAQVRRVIDGTAYRDDGFTDMPEWMGFSESLLNPLAIRDSRR